MYDDVKTRIMESFQKEFDDYNNIINESGLSRVLQHMGDRSVGFITAFRGGFTKNENQQRNRKLLAELMRINKDFGITKVKGSYIENYGGEAEQEVQEATFMVVSPTEGDDGRYLESVLTKLGQKFDQDSVLVKNYNDKATLIGTTRRADSFIKLGERQKVGSFSGGKVAEFMTRIKGRPFTFESAEMMHYPDSVFGKLSMKIVAEDDSILE